MDFYASESHFIDHLLPIYKAMESESRFFTTRNVAAYARRVGINPSRGLPGDTVAVASYGNMKRMRPRNIIYLEHGVGMQYGNGHKSYSGGTDRGDIGLYLATNEMVASRQREVYPDQNIQVIGCPKLDRWHRGHAIEKPVKTVAISFHWDCQVAPETRSAFPHYRNVLPDIVDEFRVIGHGHPRDWGSMRGFWKRLGVRTEGSFEEVMRLADLYVCDNSSTLYEFASTGRPVVVLNAPYYRRSVHHGLRFWEDIPGVQVNEPNELAEAIHLALSDPSEIREERSRISDLVYPNRGNATKTAVRAIRDYEAGLQNANTPR